MRERAWWALVLGAIATACATGSIVGGDHDAAAPGDATLKGDATPKGDGSATCQSPSTKCTASDGGVTCADLTSDPSHCGTCTTACEVTDGGGVTPGTNNPAHPGIVYDSGVGWTTGSPACDASACATACPQGFTECSDGLCYDTQNHHDHCGTCSTACTSQQWCNHGRCCGLGQESCNGSCVDVLSNNANCGACGNACSGGTPTCVNGACAATCTPTGTRQPYNTLQSKTATGCLTTSPCATSTYNWSSLNIQAFSNIGENIVCSGTTACVSHVGINNYADTQVCQGTWDVYCDSTKVGSLVTVGKTCSGSPMSNGCSISFSPMTCSTIKLQLAAGNTTGCCNGSPEDTSISGVTAW